LKVLIIGGAGYVGVPLAHSLQSGGHDVSVLDLFWYGDALKPTVQRFKGDLRDQKLLRQALRDQDAVIHLACVSNDPSSELKPSLTRSINFESFPETLIAVREANVRRFIFASSSSVYGIQDGDVTESRPCAPLTDYSRYKELCERMLWNTDMGNVAWTVLRPATVCGWSPRMRFDLVVNAMTRAALRDKVIPVTGGDQLRPNIHISDMVSAYAAVLSADIHTVHSRTYNVGGPNLSLRQIADAVAAEVSLLGIRVEPTPTDDKRSYHIDSGRIAAEIGFQPTFSVERAVSDICEQTSWGMNFNFDETRFFNVRRMKELFP